MMKVNLPRVLMVAESNSGGTARHIVEVSRACRNRGLDVHLVCPANRDTDLNDGWLEISKAGGNVYEINMQREIHPVLDSIAAFHLRRIVVDIAPDVLHLHSSKAGAIGRVAVTGLGHRRPKVVYTPHSYAFLAQPGRLNRLGYWCVERALIPWIDYVVAVSESEGKAASKLGANCRVMVIPNGVDAERVAPQKASRLSGFRVGWLGRMVWQKDLETALRASFVLSKLNTDHELLIGGDGTERQQVLKIVCQLQSEKWVRFLGFVHDTNTFYAGIDLLLITSRTEGLPYTGLDAMANGIPIVGFDVPGVRDLVKHCVTGLLAKPGDVGALAAHIARLARDRDLCQAMGRAAQQRVRKSFRLEDQVNKLCGLYQSLAS